jgi:hypothetical protein
MKRLLLLGILAALVIFAPIAYAKPPADMIIEELSHTVNAVPEGVIVGVALGQATIPPDNTPELSDTDHLEQIIILLKVIVIGIGALIGATIYRIVCGAWEVT